MHLIWSELKEAAPLIVNGNPTLWAIIGFTLKVAAISCAIATLIGVPIGVVIGLGRFRGRGILHALANISLGLPPAAVGVVLYLILSEPGPLGGLHLIWTREVVYVAQTILALPFTVALTAAAVQGAGPDLLAQARALGARRWQLAVLALREARIGVIAAIIAALGTALSEVAAIALLGGNIYGYDQTLASASLYEVNAAHYADATAIGIVLLALIVILIGGLSLLQHRGGGLRMRFRAA